MAIVRNEATGLVILMAGIAAVGIQALMLSPLLPDIAATLAAGPREIGVASGAYGAGVALLALIAAPRLGFWPKARAIQLSFGVMALGLALCAFAWDWRVLVAGQFVAGAASGIIIPGTYALTTEIATPEKRSRAIGKVLFGWSIAMVAGIPVAAFIADFAGWRGSFAVVAIIAAAMIFAIALLMPQPAALETKLVRYADALRVAGIPLVLVATFAYMIGFYQTYTFVGDYIRHLHQAGAWLGGLLACSYGLGFGAAIALDGWIDRVGARRLMAVALFLVGLNYAVLPFALLNVWTAVAYPLLWGLANHLCMNTLVSFIGQSPPEERATAMGLFSFVTYLAVFVGGAVYGSIYAGQGFMTVSLAATATLWIATVLVSIMLPRRATA
ncbi:MFS transporter [soil metagenome]